MFYAEFSIALLILNSASLQIFLEEKKENNLKKAPQSKYQQDCLNLHQYQDNDH